MNEIIKQTLEKHEILEEKIQKAIDIALKYNYIDGKEHKKWIIDQMVKVLAEGKYDEIIEKVNSQDGYEWEEGISP